MDGIKQGSIKVYYLLKIMPSGKDTVVKSIQMHDNSLDESNSRARVGLVVKGMTVEQISKGDILCSENSSHIKVVSPATQQQQTLPQQYPVEFMKNSS